MIRYPVLPSDDLNGGWSFKIMLDRKPFSSIPNWNVAGQKMPFIVTGRKSICWKYGETNHHSATCPEKNISGILTPTDQNPPPAESVKPASPLLGMPATGTSVVKPPVGSLLRPPFPVKPLPTACAIM